MSFIVNYLKSSNWQLKNDQNLTDNWHLYLPPPPSRPSIEKAEMSLYTVCHVTRRSSRFVDFRCLMRSQLRLHFPKFFKFLYFDLKNLSLSKYDRNLVRACFLRVSKLMISSEWIRQRYGSSWSDSTNCGCPFSSKIEYNSSSVFRNHVTAVK